MSFFRKNFRKNKDKDKDSNGNPPPIKESSSPPSSSPPSLSPPSSPPSSPKRPSSPISSSPILSSILSSSPVASSPIASSSLSSSRGDDGAVSSLDLNSSNSANGNEDIDTEKTEDRKHLVSKLAGMIGKDVTSMFSLPVSLFEPSSVLQTMCEPLRYADLIEQASELDDPIERMCYIATFCVAVFSIYVRTAKPFNPVIGETFEYVPARKEYKTLAEQVCHHPPIGLVQTVADKWSLQQESHIETKLWGNSVDVMNLGVNHIEFPAHNDHYSWKNPSSCVHNLLIGKLWVEHFGPLPIKNVNNGISALVTFKKAGWFEGIRYDISGEVRDAQNKVRAVVAGKWNEAVSIQRVELDGRRGPVRELWRKPVAELTKWGWPPFMVEVTAIDEESALPHTDSRLRADLRALAAGNTKLAGKEKTRIEERQRAKRKEREMQNRKWEPVQFRKVPDDKFEYRWQFVGSYWEDREARIRARQQMLRDGIKSEPINVLRDSSEVVSPPPVLAENSA